MAKPILSFGPRFLDCLVRLPKPIHSKFVKSLDLLSRNPQHPGLNVEPLQGRAKGLYSARVDVQYRLIFAQPSEEDVRLLFIGTHDAYAYAETVGPQQIQEARNARVPLTRDTLENLEQLTSVTGKKYHPLSKHLMEQPSSVSRLDMTFLEVEQVIGNSLPQSARKYREWWANDRTRHVQASAWLGVGWKTQQVRVVEQRVSFVRASNAAAHG